MLASDMVSGDEFGAAIALSQDGQILVVGAPAHDVGGNSNQGQAYVFQRSGTSWSEQQKLVAPDGEAGDLFGTSVALADAPDYTIVVGAPYADAGGFTDIGAAYVFDYDGSTWSPTKLAPSDAGEDSSDQRGSSVAVSTAGDTVLVGAPGVNGPSGSEPGAVYVFDWDGAAWSQTQKIEGSTTSAAGMGRSMTLSDNGGRLFVGGKYAVGGGGITYGIVWIYEQLGGTWMLADSLAPSDGVEFDEFGASMASSSDGTTVLIGAPSISDGQVYLFTKSGSIWTEEAILTPPGGSLYGKFGQAVTMDTVGTQAAIGAWLNGGGAVHRLEWTGSAWDHLEELNSWDERQEQLGFALGMSGDGSLIAGGARQAHSSRDVFDQVGAVYVFVPGYKVYLPVVRK